MNNYTKIPQILHLVFLSKTEQLPVIFTQCIENLKKLHPSWTIKIYNEDNAQIIISKYLPELLPVYNSYSHYIQRADLFRAILVYLYGGFYMDMDMYCMKTLDELLKYDLILPEERTITTKQRARLAQLDGIVVRHNFRLGNYMFGGIAKHPFWPYYFKEAINISQKEVKHEGDILETTGPALLTKVYHKYGKHFPTLLVLHNRDRQCMMPFHNEISCHFGNFAAHLHQGTWRWMRKNNNLLLKNSIEPRLISEANKAIYSKIKSIVSQKVYLIKQADTELQNMLYRQLSVSTIPYSKSAGLKKNNCRVIIIGIDSFNKHKLSPHIKYTLVLDHERSKLSKPVLEKIKKYEVKCIAFSRSIEGALAQSHASSIHKADMFYIPVKRDFSEDDTPMAEFTIGLYADFSAASIKWMKALRKALNGTGEQYQLEVFYNNAGYKFSNKSAIDGIAFTNMNSATLAERLNRLSAFLCYTDNIESSLLLQTVLYLGIPCIANKNDSLLKKDILKFALCYNNSNSNNIDPIATAITRLKNNYTLFNKKSLQASRYIEDKYSIEKTAYDIIKIALD